VIAFHGNPVAYLARQRLMTILNIEGAQRNDATRNL
jgi:hypothetical protein